MEHTPAALAVFDREMRYLAVSRRFASDYRLRAEDLIGRSHYDVFPEVPDRWRQVHQRCLAGATERCEEDSFLRADGTLDWVRWEICPWREASGEIGGIVLFTEIITERKRAEAALRERELELERLSRELQTVLDTVPAAIYISHDAAGRRIDANRYGRELLRARPGQNVSRSAPSGDQAPYRVLRQGVEVAAEALPVQVASARGEDVRDWECTVSFEDGTSVDLLGYATPLASGGAVAAFMDITRRRSAEEALRAREAWYRAIFDQSEAALVVLEAVEDGGEIVDFVYRDANPAALRAMGTDREHVISHRATELLPEGRVAALFGGWRRVLETGQPWSAEWSHGRGVDLVTAFRMDDHTLGTASVDLSRTLNKILPICAWCRRIRDETGTYSHFEDYIRGHTDTHFTHGICPECLARHFTVG